MHTTNSLSYIVGMGELLWDMLPDGKKVGGAPANFANHIANLGLNGLIVSAVGNDSLGNEILDSLKNSKAKLAVAQTTYPTGTVNVHLDGNGIPSYEICENTAWDNIPFTPELEEIARQTRAVCFGSLAQRSSVSRNTIERFLDAMPADSLKIFDINLRQNYYSKEIISNSLKRCDIFKINDEELEIVKQLFQIEIEDAEECCRHMVDRFSLRNLVLTCGTNGSYVFSKEEQRFFPTPKVEVVDTVGAGDSFTAAFVASILKGRDQISAHARAVEISAYVCTQHGATPELPDTLKR